MNKQQGGIEMTLLHYLGLTPKHRQNYLAGIKQSTPDAILKSVISYTGISFEALQSKSRKQPIVFARFIAMYLIKSRTELSLRQIGDIFYRDHTTVINAVNTTNDLLETHKEFRKMYERIEKNLYISTS